MSHAIGDVLARMGEWRTHYDANPKAVGASEWHEVEYAMALWTSTKIALEVAVARHNKGACSLRDVSLVDATVTDARGQVERAIAAWAAVAG